MEKNIGVKTYLLAWLLFSIATAVSTLGLEFLTGVIIGVAMSGRPMQDVVSTSQSAGIVTVIPYLALSSLVWFCVCVWFFFGRHSTKKI